MADLIHPAFLILESFCEQLHGNCASVGGLLPHFCVVALDDAADADL